MPGRGARERRRRHFYRTPAGAKPRAAFATEAEAHAAANRVLAATGRRYSAYACGYRTCRAWHIEPCRRRAGDFQLTRSA